VAGPVWMIAMFIEVESYSGYRPDERPFRFAMSGRTYEVIEVEDRWYSPRAMYFRVVASDGSRYVLYHDEEANFMDSGSVSGKGDCRAKSSGRRSSEARAMSGEILRPRVFSVLGRICRASKISLRWDYAGQDDRGIYGCARSPQLLREVMSWTLRGLLRVLCWY
jgi:hypothetical protein